MVGKLPTVPTRCLPSRSLSLYQLVAYRVSGTGVPTRFHFRYQLAVSRVVLAYQLGRIPYQLVAYQVLRERRTNSVSYRTNSLLTKCSATSVPTRSHAVHVPTRCLPSGRGPAYQLDLIPGTNSVSRCLPSGWGPAYQLGRSFKN